MGVDCIVFVARGILLYGIKNPWDVFPDSMEVIHDGNEFEECGVLVPIQVLSRRDVERDDPEFLGQPASIVTKPENWSAILNELNGALLMTSEQAEVTDVIERIRRFGAKYPNMIKAGEVAYRTFF